MRPSLPSWQTSIWPLRHDIIAEAGVDRPAPLQQYAMALRTHLRHHQHLPAHPRLLRIFCLRQRHLGVGHRALTAHQKLQAEHYSTLYDVDMSHDLTCDGQFLGSRLLSHDS